MLHSAAQHKPELRVLHIASGDLWAGAEVALFQLVTALADPAQAWSLKSPCSTTVNLPSACATREFEVHMLDEQEAWRYRAACTTHRNSPAFPPGSDSHPSKQGTPAWCTDRRPASWRQFAAHRTWQRRKPQWAQARASPTSSCTNWTGSQWACNAVRLPSPHRWPRNSGAPCQG